MKLINYLTILSLILSFSCQSKKEKDSSWDVTSYKITKDKQPLKDWKCIEINSDKICIPKVWKHITQDVTFFFAYLNNINDNTYFAIAKFDTESDQMNAESYLNEMYNQALNSNSEKFEGYTVKKLIFKDMKSYHSEFYTTIDSINYLMYSMVFEYRGFTYDFALKVERENADQYKDIFRDILFNFSVNENPVFNDKDKLVKVEIIELPID